MTIRAHYDGEADNRTIGEGLPVRPVQAFRSSQFLQELETEIERRQAELDKLLAAKDVLLGTPRGAAVSPHSTFATVPTTLADAVEQILTGVETLHVKRLLEELASRFSMKTTQKNLINTLNRWVSRKRRFKRVQPNTFAIDARPNGHSQPVEESRVANGGNGGNGGNAHSGGSGGNGNGGNGHARPTTKLARKSTSAGHRRRPS